MYRNRQRFKKNKLLRRNESWSRSWCQCCDRPISQTTQLNLRHASQTSFAIVSWNCNYCWLLCLLQWLIEGDKSYKKHEAKIESEQELSHVLLMSLTRGSHRAVNPRWPNRGQIVRGPTTLSKPHPHTPLTTSPSHKHRLKEAMTDNRQTGLWGECVWFRRVVTSIYKLVWGYSPQLPPLQRKRACQNSMEPESSALCSASRSSSGRACEDPYEDPNIRLDTKLYLKEWKPVLVYNPENI